MLLSDSTKLINIIPKGDPSLPHTKFPFFTGNGNNMGSKIFEKPHSKISGFFSWAGNHLTFQESIIGKYVLFALIFLALILMLIFKDSIRNWVQKNPKWIMIAGWVGIVFFVFNRILLIVGDYPLKWEIVPLHMCRLAGLLTLMMMAFNKHKHIKYIIFWAEIGAIIGLLYFHLNGVSMGSTQNIGKGQVFRVYTYTNVGLDNYFWWDYALLHSFAIIAPVFLWIGLKIKVSWKEMWISIFWLWLMGSLAFVIDWIFQGYGVDYIYLSKNPSFKIPISIIGDWPYVYFTYTFLFIIVINLIYGLWIVEGFFHFRKFKINKVNDNWEYFKKTAPNWIKKRLVKNEDISIKSQEKPNSISSKEDDEDIDNSEK